MKKNKGMKKLVLFLLVFSMVIQFAVMPALAETICTHHIIHDDGCDYLKGAECTFVCEECKKAEDPADVRGDTAAYNGQVLTTASVTQTGDGTADNPYQISNSEQLHEFAWWVNSGGKPGACAKLMNNIVYNYDGNSDGETDRWYAFGGNGDNIYTGIFDGNGYTISGLWLNDANGQNSFIRYLGASGVVKNLTIIGSFTGSSNMGGIVGQSYGTVSNCIFEGTVTGDGFNAGGIVGKNWGKIIGCINNGTVTSNNNSNTGGIVGINEIDGSVSLCTNNATVSGVRYVGGIVGENKAMLQDCYNNGSISASEKLAGGIVGVNAGTVSGCLNTASVTGQSSGGLAGKNQSGATIRNSCYDATKCTDMYTIATDLGVKENCKKYSTNDFKNNKATIVKLLNGGEIGAWKAGTTYPVLSSGGAVTPTTYTVAVTPSPTEGGTVFGNGSYEKDASVTVTATANKGYTFVNWTENGTEVSTEANYTFTVTGNRTLVAVFEAHEHQWSYTVNDAKDTITAICDNTDNQCINTNGGSVNISVSDRIYDGTAVTASVEKTGVLTNKTIGIVYSEKDGTTLDRAPSNAGTYIASITLGNATASVQFTIEKEILTVTAKDNNIIYGDAPANAGVTYAGFVNGETADVLEGELAYSYNYEKYGNVGIYKITPSGVTSDNYNITFVDGSLTVNAKAVTITAKDQTIVWGDTISGTEVTSVGLVDGHNVTVTLTPSTANVTADGTVTASAAVITDDGTDVTANYKITYANGKLVIKPNTSKIDGLTTENVTSANEADIQAVQEMMEHTDSVQDDWVVISQICGDLLATIQAAREAINTENTEKVKDITVKNVILENKKDLENAKEDLENALADKGSNYTEDEKNAIMDEINRIEDALKVIENVEAVEKLIHKIPKTVTKDDEAAIKAADEAYNALTDYEKSLVGEVEKKVLADAKADIAELNKPVKPSTGDNSNTWLWLAFLFVSGAYILENTLNDRKRRTTSKR